MSDPSSSLKAEERLKQYIAQNLIYSADGYHHADDASFMSEGIIDSLSVMHLVEYVEKDFGITVPLADVTPDNFDSVTRIAAYIRKARPGTI